MRRALVCNLKSDRGALIFVSHDHNILRHTLENFYLLKDHKVFWLMVKWETKRTDYAKTELALKQTDLGKERMLYLED